MSTTRKRTAKAAASSDIKLALGVVVLWTFGQVIGPLRYVGDQGARDTDVLIAASMLCYVLMHLVVFGYCGMLLYDALKTHSRKTWEMVLYMYVLIAIAVSLFFIAYQLGYFPTFMGSLFPSQPA